MQSIYLLTRKKGPNLVPCVVYGKDKLSGDNPFFSENFSISQDQIKIIKSHKLKARALPLKVSFAFLGKEYHKSVVLKSVQFHPINLEIRHLDFFIIDELEKFETLLHIRVIGKESSVAIKEGAIVNQMFKQIKAMRSHYSHTDEIVVDVSNLKKKAIVRANDLNIKDIHFKNNPVILTIL